jgi:sialidase-1
MKAYNRQLRHCAAALLLAGLCAWAAAPEFSSQTLFHRGEGNYLIYRIPGIVVTKAGTILAYAEARASDKGDWNAADILLRRSEDGGKTFSPPVKIASVSGPHVKNPVALMRKLGPPDAVTYSNPVMIADPQSGVVHFLFDVEYMRAFYSRSDDDGKTFSKPVEITSAFDAFRKGYDWKVLATGPGHGIRLRNGRLVVPVWLSLGTGNGAHRPSIVTTIYSGDQGRTWHAGEIAVPDTPEWINPNETAAIQLAGGRVMLNVRSESKAQRRIVVYSRDGATGWSRPEFQAQLVEPICFGSMARITERPPFDRNRILFVNPDNLARADGKDAPGISRDRKNLTVQMSYNEGKSWTVKRTIDAGSSGYSDLAVLPDGEVLCWYEKGIANQFPAESLVLARFNVEWLSHGRDSIRRKK